MNEKSTTAFDGDAAFARVERIWDDEIVPMLGEYIRIPCLSPDFDAQWREHGHLDRAATLLEEWCRERPIPGLQAEMMRLEERTPLLYMEASGTGEGTVLLYGHYDKQPEMEGWREDLGPWKPVLEGDRLYGRGGADDGYAAPAALTALQVLSEQGLPFARCVVLIEGCEESGSGDLPAYVEHLADRIGAVDLVICLDSGCGDYDRMWTTRSLRGMAAGDLRVEILTEGVHSGDASGIIPDSFRILRKLLSRLEDQETGALVPDELYVEIPEEYRVQAAVAADALGEGLVDKYPLVEGAATVETDPTELILNQTWRPTVTVTGIEGLPPIENAGNVLRPITAAKLSLRLPPPLDGEKAVGVVKELLEARPPYGARVSFGRTEGCSGWEAPPIAPWLKESLDVASETFFGRLPAHRGEGGTIPLMGLLAERFPGAQFVVTGVGGPGSNAHGPNEFLHVPMVKRLTACVARILFDHARR